MVNALRLISVQRGHDPRRFALIAFGGAGPVHVNRLADENEIPLTVVPASPGTFSALGLLVTDLKHDYSVTLLRPLARLEPAEADAGYRRLEDRGREALRRECIAEENVHCVRKVDMRYVGQSFELSLPVPHGRLKDHDLQALRNAFHQAHDHTYGFSAPQEPVELVNLRLTAIGRIAKPRPHELPTRSSDASQARKASRPVHFVEAGGFVDCPVYERQHLGSGCRIVGPAIVEEIDSTTVIHPGYAATVDPYGNLLLRKRT
jgi:N-methylhydantoinase A